jgi:hypothetical protein
MAAHLAMLSEGSQSPEVKSEGKDHLLTISLSLETTREPSL